MLKKLGLVGLVCSLLAGSMVYGEEGKEECSLKKVRCGKTTIGLTKGVELLRKECKKPAEGISFPEIKTGEEGENILFQSAGDIEEGETCGWRSYQGTKYKASPEVKIFNIGNKLSDDYTGIRVEYTHPEDDLDPRNACKKTSWLGIYHTFRAYDCGYADSYRCADLSEKKGIKFFAQGKGKLRVQLTEGYEGCVHFGEIYEYLINLTEKGQEYKIPFEKFTFRKDWQMGEEELERIRKKSISSRTVSEFLDCQLDLGIMQALTLEGLCLDNDVKCRKGEKRHFEIKGLKFY